VKANVTELSTTRNERILVIDDDAIMRELLPLLLGAEGHTVLTAESGDAALALLATLAPDEMPTVVLTDLKMPGLSSTALALRLRLVCRRSTVLLAMSGSEPAKQAEAYDVFLAKPFDVAGFAAAVQRVRDGLDGKASSSAVASVSEGQSASVRVLDEAIYTKLFSVMGVAQLPQLYTLFLEDAKERVARMGTAAAGNDIDTFTREAHAIKGGCGMLGATELYSLASRMETGGFACSPLLDDFGPAFERLRRILEERLDRQDAGPKT
jgi:CheY-like chemotaxis protein